MANSTPIWIRSHNVWNERAGRFEAAALRVEDDKIVAVAQHGEVPDGAELTDFGDDYVMPGLLNTHVHLDFSGSQTPLKDFESEDPAERLLRAAGNAHRLLMSGCTTARDCGSHWTTLALARRPDLSPVPCRGSSCLARRSRCRAGTCTSCTASCAMTVTSSPISIVCSARAARASSAWSRAAR